MSTRYVSFLSGIVIASLTWAFSLYLYSKLSQNSIITYPTVLAADVSTHDDNDREIMLRNNIIPRNEKQILIDRKIYNLKNSKDHDDLLLQQLQPIPVKPAITLNQGIIALESIIKISVCQV